MNLYLYELHSYYNRKIVRYRYIYQYEENLGSSSYVANNISFNPNDGITTTQIINYPLDHPYFEGTAAPSYCLVVDDTGNIVSRWWIISHSRIRKGQANLSLLRDVIADYYDEVMTAPSFVKKGYIGSVNDPAIYNNEEMTFNQIKTSETTIRDKSRTPWYVLYLKEGIPEEQRQITIPKPSFKISGSYNTMDNYPYSRYTNPDTPFLGDYNSVGYLLYWYNNYVFDHPSYATGWRDNGQLYNSSVGQSSVAGFGTVNVQLANRGIAATIGPDPLVTLQNVASAVGASASSLGSSLDFRTDSYYFTGAHTGSALEDFLKEDGKCYQIGDKIIRININQRTVSGVVDIPNINPYAGKFLQIAENSGRLNTGTIQGTYAAVEYSAPAYYITTNEVLNASIEYDIPINVAESEDSPYTVMAIPHSFIMMDDGEDVSTNIELSRLLVNRMLKKLSSYIVDAQLLPYAPVDDAYLEAITDTLGRIRLSQLPTDVPHYTLIGDTSGEQTFVLYVSQTSWSKTINDYKITVPANSTDFKVANECDMYRLCSPNYNGQFEFSATKNGGVDSWNISFTYKPFSPYIKVAPKFDDLYGRNFFDARGLICGGDFSITQVSIEWNNYQLQNKNYQVMFDRQIENMEVNNSVQRFKEYTNIGVGIASGAVTGGIAGGMTGNPRAAAFSAAVGGVASLVGGIADLVLNEKLRQEAMDYTRDQFGYQLQNIRALPTSITKVGTQNEDYKFFPFVEYYTATNTEKQALLDKIAWNGMTIMRIGQVQNFLYPYATETGTFIQAKPIRLDYIAEDSHLAEAIAAELNTGVYII